MMGQNNVNINEMDENKKVNGKINKQMMNSLV